MQQMSLVSQLLTRGIVSFSYSLPLTSRAELTISLVCTAQAISDLLEDTHSLVQAQLPSSRPLQNTSIQFDILGIAAALFNSSNTSDASSRSKMKTAEGLVECAAAVRAFTKVEKRQRGAEKIPGYRCETGELAAVSSLLPNAHRRAQI